MTERGRKPVDIGVVIRAARWRALRLAAEDAIVEKRITAEGIRALDRWLAHRESAAVGDLSADAVLSFFADSISPTRSGSCCGPSTRSIRVIRICRSFSQAMELRSRSYRPTKERARDRRTPKVSVETRELPPEWLEVLDAMRSREYRGRQPPAPSIVVTIETKLRQLAFSARAAGVTIDFAIPALSAYVEAMLARDLASRTDRVHARQAPDVRDLCRGARAGSGGDRRGEAAARSSRLDGGQAKGAVPARIRPDARRRGAQSARLLPVGTRRDRSERAAPRLDARGALRLRHLPSASALGCPHHDRRTASARNSEGWQLFKRTRKNNYKAIGRIWDVCTPFLDGAILLGADESRFWEMYDRAEGRPLLADRQGEALSDNWATEQSRARLGPVSASCGRSGTTIAPRSATPARWRRPWRSADNTIPGRRPITGPPQASAIAWPAPRICSATSSRNWRVDTVSRHGGFKAKDGSNFTRSCRPPARGELRAMNGWPISGSGRHGRTG